MNLVKWKRLGIYLSKSCKRFFKTQSHDASKKNRSSKEFLSGPKNFVIGFMGCIIRLKYNANPNEHKFCKWALALMKLKLYYVNVIAEEYFYLATFFD